jgi:hypothetical protein
MRVKNGMIGTWTGTATTPWVAPYTVTLVFDTYTHYSAKSSGTSTTALYYGSDEDSPLKRYSVDDILASGDAVGTIDVYFGASGTNHDRLEGIELSADSSQLKFFFMHLGQYGPLRYDLVRVVP